MPLRQRISGAVLGSSMFITSYFLAVILMPLPLLLATNRPRWATIIAGYLIGLWITNTVMLSEVICGITVVITGSHPDPGDGVLIIMNHRTRLDWLLLFSYAFRYGCVDRFKVVLKWPLKFIPGAGWCMQVAKFLFVQRKWNSDKIHLAKILDHFRVTKYKPQILLFPEGTDLTPDTKSRSDSFAKKNGLTSLDYVLHPRTTGFSFLARKMIKDNLLSSVLDITVGYPDNISQTEVDVVAGNIPKEVHFHVEKFTKKELPDSTERLEKWCYDRWIAKEARLKKFYHEKNFADKQIRGMKIVKKLRMYSVFLFWCVFVSGMIILLVNNFWFRWYCLLSSLAYYASGKYFDGLDVFIP